MADTDTNTRPRTELKKRFDFMFKIVLLGDTEVGKTSMISRFVDDEFSSLSHPTIGVDFKLKILEIDGYLVKVQIWDTAGLEKYASASEMYYRGADVCFLVYDTTSRLSLNNTHRNRIINTNY
ncbi:ras-related protein Rab-13 isoform X1 [Eurytemora carolleeae]|uniref:ras-related protein Rab-13 isoform X1 n=1 Tax=Eurytemora carolleeae TaxID=1294199 RepID=UPI000C756F09|nr:ras-related protein Rab-13 isoform X1 [Eurytemora carolleeae]|eukprot:XP_023348520.1 ras-related protein Rab-13-like isoform X1 [Eurytemora affinis]